MIHAAVLALLLSSSGALVPSVKEATGDLEPAPGDADAKHAAPGKPPDPGGPAPGDKPNSTVVKRPRAPPRKYDPNDADWQPRDVAIPKEACKEKDFTFKDLDVIVFGATGTIGEIVSAYFSQKDPATFRYAIAGRNMHALDELRQKITEKNDPEPILMSLDNEFQMVQMIHRTRVILNVQGPFEESGAEKVLRMALKTCTHYVDISSEFEWQVAMMKKYDSLASTRGVAVVHSAGATAMPADFLAVRAAEYYHKWTKKPPQSIKIVRKESRMVITEGMKKTYQFVKDKYKTAKIEPYMLLPGLTGEFKVDTAPDGMNFNGYSRNLRWYKNAPMDCAVVRRSLYKRFERPIEVSEAEKRAIFNWKHTEPINAHGDVDGADEGTGPIYAPRDDDGDDSGREEEAEGNATTLWRELLRERAADNATKQQWPGGAEDNTTTKIWPAELPLVSGRDLLAHSFPLSFVDKFYKLLKNRLGASVASLVRAGFYQAEAHAFGHPTEGREVRVYMIGMHDITLLGTAMFAGELAHGLADGGPLKQQGGYLTPALALGTERLLDGIGLFTTIGHEIVHDPDAPKVAK